MIRRLGGGKPAFFHGLRFGGRVRPKSLAHTLAFILPLVQSTARLPGPDAAGTQRRQTEGATMIQHDQRRRCQARRSIRSHQGLVTAECGGTIEGEIDNLGRRLISVRWDTGLTMYVFPEEIEVDYGVRTESRDREEDYERERF